MMATIHGNPHAASILSIIVFGLVFVPLSFGFRLWARSLSAVAFWWDDLLMGFALVSIDCRSNASAPLTYRVDWRFCSRC